MILEHRIHRIVHNSTFWQKPCEGRRQKDGYGEHVKTHGFGQEDWNFNTEDAINDYIYGYTRAVPAKRFANTRFNLGLVTWDRVNHWQLVGYYLDAMFTPDGAALTPTQLARRSDEIADLKRTGDLGGKYKNKPSKEITNELKSELKYFHWKVATKNVFLVPEPIKIPRTIFRSGSERLTTSNTISEENFEQLLALANSATLPASEAPALIDAGDISETFPEGKFRTRQHTYRERDGQKVQQAKKAFEHLHGKLYCQACGCDFGDRYGEKYIEAHHMIPISKLSKNGGETKLSDLAMVCANCHRMLHRKRPWIDRIEDLPSILTRK